MVPMPSRIILALVTLASAVYAAAVSGEAVYQQRCARCHDSGNARVPSRDALKKLPVVRIRRSMDFGTMGNVSSPLRHDEREAVAAHLGTAAGGGKAEWNGWSPAPSNTRFQPAAAAGLSLDQVRQLKLKWAYGFDGDIVAFAQPTVLDRNLFLGSASGHVQALNMDSGCVRWTFQAEGPVRAAIAAAPLGDKHALLFGDQTGWFYALEAETGRLLWKKKPEPNESVRLTAAPAVYQGTVFIGVASWEEGRTNNPE